MISRKKWFSITKNHNFFIFYSFFYLFLLQNEKWPSCRTFDRKVIFHFELVLTRLFLSLFLYDIINFFLGNCVFSWDSFYNHHNTNYSVVLFHLLFSAFLFSTWNTFLIPKCFLLCFYSFEILFGFLSF